MQELKCFFLMKAPSLKYYKEIDQNKAGQDGIIDRKLKESSLIVRNRRADSLARLGHLLDVQKIAGSNPARPTI